MYAVVGIPALWLVLGFAGQVLLSSRFLVQWVGSERSRRSVMPRLFWWLSLGGGVLLFSYACLRRDPVIMAGQAAGLMVYTRNLMLLQRQAT